MAEKRPSKDEYYLDFARAISKRATCLRRKFGAVIVRDDQIISCGYCGSPRGAPNCIDIGKCLRDELKVPSGERYELCRSVHAEANAVINAARSGVSVLGGTIYVCGENAEDGETLNDSMPCQMCRRVIINSGIKRVVVPSEQGTHEYFPKDWTNGDEVSLNGY
ncbi:dCMP deaminase family protein [Patescibacteria group bacterium]|nr:dCMP deaminase family protein [Patescibacteria group bacterium]MBU4023385.1 dCMP deaminase family protein [Patescibacteria group bacterium]MBU4078248.1 dCMP deaminase family protein [Patescibacteria group bacterium]